MSVRAVALEARPAPGGVTPATVGIRRPGRVTGLARQGRRVTGVTADGGTIEGDAVVIAMGPWSILAGHWLPLPAVYGLKGHSLVFDTGTSVPAEALFAEYREPTGALSTPEVFPRDDGTTYVCAISSDTPLPVDPANVAPDPGAIERLEGICRRLSPVLASRLQAGRVQAESTRHDTSRAGDQRRPNRGLHGASLGSTGRGPQARSTVTTIPTHRCHASEWTRELASGHELPSGTTRIALRPDAVSPVD